MNEQEVIEKARGYFLREDNLYGCAETTLMVLKEAFGLPEPEDSSAAMALNGGVAYAGAICGALSGAAMAAGLLAGRRISDHKQAKRAAAGSPPACGPVQDALALDCRELIGLDIATSTSTVCSSKTVS
jgi:hypothetical protein